MSLREALIATAKTATAEQVRVVLTTSKKGFLDLFSGFMTVQDLQEIDALFEAAVVCKLRQFMASTPADAQYAADEYEANLASILTVGLRYEIVGKAKAGILVRSVAHQVISGAFAVAGAVFQAGMGVVLPGVGSLLGAGINMGVQHVVAYFLGG